MITSISWAPDDNFIMAIIGKIHEIHVRCFNSEVVENSAEGWQAVVADELAGIDAAIWSADSRQILTWANNNLRVSIWSLISSSLSAYISSPKMLPPKGIAFSENKKFAALAERKDGRDAVGIYYAGNEWKMVNQLDIDTFDMQDLRWVNGDSAIMVWENALESKILVYSVGTGDLLTKYEPEVIGLGIKSLTLSTNKTLTAAGMFDGSI